MRATLKLKRPITEIETNLDETSIKAAGYHISRWIPVSERLPEDGTWNIFTDGKRVSIERYKMDIISHFFPAGRFFKLEDAVAWMPVPEPYDGARMEGEDV